MNKVILIGRLTRDPECRYSQGTNQITVARFSLAVDRRFKREGEPDADYFNCSAFGKQADFVEKYLKKGIKMVVTGRIQNDNYTNNNGEKVYSVRIMVEELEFAESKNVTGGSESHHSQDNEYQQTSRPTPSAADGFMNIPDGIDEELPFN